MFSLVHENNMTSLLPSRYQLKKAVLWPRTMFMRWKYRKTSGSMKAMMELHYYRPSLFEFVGATIYNKHILHEADIDSDSVVIDVGAFTGSWAQHMVERYDPVIYAFEPNPNSFARLQEKAVNNPKLQPMPYGLGDEDVTVEFTLKGLGSSMCDERSSHSDTPRIAVDIAAIDRVWKELEFGRVDLMKINIEGAEFPLLDKMIKADLLKNVDCFMIQFHEWPTDAYRKRQRIREELSKTHRLEWDYYFIWEKWVRI
jgi:FkbM family methyltransferase